MGGIRYSLTRTTDPDPLVVIKELKEHARITTDAEDGLLETLISAAQDALETELGIALVTQTLVLRLDRFPTWEIRLPRPPLQSVTSIQYIDADGVTQTLGASTYTVDIYGEVGRVVPAYGLSWPGTRDVPAAVSITYEAGAQDVELVAPKLRAAWLRLATTYYENREVFVLGTIKTPLGLDDRLLANHRCLWEPEYH